MTAEAIRICGLAKSFGHEPFVERALCGIDATIQAGELTYLIGESGSGKTTLISIIAGILDPTAGHVELFGTDVYHLEERHRALFRLQTIGFVFQRYNLISSLSALENAGIPLIASGQSEKEAQARAYDMLDRLAIADHAHKLPRELSGGQQQRVAIARALIHEPKLVVCDEPTSALDAKWGRRVMDLLREVALTPDRAVIIVTHDHRVFDLADRTLTMEDGQIIDDARQTKPQQLETQS